MRRLLILSVLLFTFKNTLAQEFKAALSYNYIYAKQWDRHMQTYNLSRPFVVEKQPLFMHGAHISVATIFKSAKKLNHGIDLSYGYFKSSAQNENLNTTLSLHFVNLSYLLHYASFNKMKCLYVDVLISATSSGLFKNVNGKSVVYEEKKARSFGIGGDLSLKAGYYLKLKNKMHLSPFILVGYTPYFYSPNTEVVINQTKGLTGKNWTGIFNTQIGLAFHIKHES